MRLVAGANLRIDPSAQVTADGSPFQTKTGAGTGGSVWITCATLEGSGSVQAKGGQTVHSSGTGGRVAVYVRPIWQGCCRLDGLPD